MVKRMVGDSTRIYFKMVVVYMYHSLLTHSGVLPWRIPGMAELGGLPSMGSHRVGHD